MRNLSTGQVATPKRLIALHLPELVGSKKIANFCRRWNIATMSLFGSVLREDYDDESDIDVLVEFEPDGVPGIEFVAMASELSIVLGRPVDIVTHSAVERCDNYILRKEILETAKVIYATR